jgi:hypothetical protein
MRGRGTARLLTAIDSRIRQHTDTAPVLELATVCEDGALQPDGFQEQIPLGEYLVLRGYTPLAQDRVLVAWINEGRDAIVLDVVEET